MATVNVSTSYTTDITDFHYEKNGDIVMQFSLNDANGNSKFVKRFRLKADGSGVYDVADGSQLTATSPTTLINNLTNAKSNGDTALTNIANKITP